MLIRVPVRSRSSPKITLTCKTERKCHWVNWTQVKKMEPRLLGKITTEKMFYSARHAESLKRKRTYGSSLKYYLGLRSHHASIASFCLLLDWGGEKEALPESRQAFDVTAARNSGLFNLVFPRQTSFFECEHPFIDKPMVITEPVVPRTWLLRLGSKLSPSNMQRMLNKDLTRFMQSLAQVSQIWGSERKALL